jgi:hypothetical protein
MELIGIANMCRNSLHFSVLVRIGLDTYALVGLVVNLGYIDGLEKVVMDKKYSVIIFI